jgi:hypothetical protein
MSWLHGGPLPPIWPPDRFEVRSVRPAPDRGTADRYSSAERAYEAVTKLRDAGLAIQIQVIRLEDGITLFDLLAGIEEPLENW